MSVLTRFKTLLVNLALTQQQVENGGARRESVVRVLNKHYWRTSSGTVNSLYVGSWGKRTRIRPPRDVDVLFSLPASVYERFELRSGNRQSQLLQEVRSVILAEFSRTDVKGDGPVVIVPFTAYNVEVIPAFTLRAGGHYVCMTGQGGYYEFADYAAEQTAIADSDNSSGGNTRHLIRMMKAWQGECGVPLKSFFIEMLVVKFLDQWEHSGRSEAYYDWMVRDFLGHITGCVNGYISVPGTGERMFLGSMWESKAITALRRATKACDYEAEGDDARAGDEWQKIFGANIPKWS